MRPVAVLLGVLAPFVSGVVLSAATVEYDLNIARQTVNFTGQPAPAMTLNGQLPGPTLRFTEGDRAVIRVHNQMDVETSIHWHGLLLPNAMDGVPFLTQPPIAPGETFTYEFDLRQSGTYWYHSHTTLQEQRGLFGAFVITSKFAGGPMQVVSADGLPVQPFDEQRMLIAVAETYDVIVTVPPDGSYELRATAHDASGHASLWIGNGPLHPGPDVPHPDLYDTMGGLSFNRVFALTPARAMGMLDRKVRAKP